LISFKFIKDDLVQSKSIDNYAKIKRLVLTLIIINSMLLGVVLGIDSEDENKVFQYLCGFPIFIMTLVWCHLNAYSLGYRINIQLKVLLILFFYIGFPIYLLQAGGFKFFFKTLLFILILMFCAIVAGAVTLMILSG
jgi:hypothetical protein